MATFNERLIRLERQMKEANKRITLGASTHTVTSGGSKFGVEDAVAAEARSFNFSGYDFDMSSGSLYFSLTGSNPNSRDIYMETGNPSTGNAYAYFEIHSNENTPNSTTWIDIYTQNEAGDVWSEIYLNNTDIYIGALLTDIQDLDGDGGIKLERDPITYANSKTTIRWANGETPASDNSLFITPGYLELYYSETPGNVWSDVYLDSNGIYLGVGDPSQFITIEGVQAGTAVSNLGLDVDNNLVLATGGAGGATPIVLDSNGEWHGGPNDTYKESAYFRFTMDADSVYFFKFVIPFQGGSTDFQLTTKFTGDVGLLMNAQLLMTTPTIPTILADNIDGYTVNHGTPIVWDTKVGYVNGSGMILSIEGTIANTNITPATIIFNWKVMEGYGSSYLSIGQGCGGFYQKLGAYYYAP